MYHNRNCIVDSLKTDKVIIKTMLFHYVLALRQAMKKKR